MIFGQSGRGGFTPNPFLLPTSLNGTNGFDIYLGYNSWPTDASLTVVKGDFNGDGIDDLLIVGDRGNCWPPLFQIVRPDQRLASHRGHDNAQHHDQSQSAAEHHRRQFGDMRPR